VRVDRTEQEPEGRWGVVKGYPLTLGAPEEGAAQRKFVEFKV